MKNKIYIDVERQISLDLDGNADNKDFIEFKLIKEIDGKTETAYLEVGETFEELKEKEYDTAYNLLKDLLDEGKDEWIIDIVNVGEYDYAGKKVEVTLKDIIIFCREEYKVENNDKQWIMNVIKPYLKSFKDNTDYEDFIFNLLKFTLNEDLETDEIVKYFDSLNK
ncbi:hypothetical protein [Niallia sp. FSL M8-0099]|uniref:hypothetical protein n=1 Tax=Niallia sp. FSL M8-0099 TaxID=2954519 RepID=UPI0030FAACAF